MKICLISNLYEPYCRGGAEKIVKMTAEAFSKNHEVVVIATQPKGESKEKNDRLTIYRFRPRNVFYSLNDFQHSIPLRLVWHFFDLFNFSSARKVKKILLEERPDLVICHNLKGLGYLIPRVIEKLRIKYAQVLHDVQYAVPSGLIIKGQENSFVVKGFLTTAYQRICRKLITPEVVISPSKWLLSFYLEKNFFKNSKPAVLPNPVKIEKHQSAYSNFDNVNKANFIFVGQIEKHKGIEFLLATVKDMPEIKLSVVGEGTLLEKLKIKYQKFENIKFLGKVETSRLKSIFETNAYLIMPTLCYENSPTVIYESFSFGRPVIVANIGGAAELVEDGKTGYIFAAGNGMEMARKIRLAVSTENYSMMSDNCFKKIRDFSIENYLDRLLKMIL